MDVYQQLEQEEGRRATVYLDSLGFQTIGVGRLVDPRKRGAGLRQSEMDLMLGNDVRDKTAGLLSALPWAAALNEPRMAVLLQMAFQMGLDGLLSFTNTLAFVKAGRWADARKGMLASKWATQTPERARRLARQMETGVWV